MADVANQQQAATRQGQLATIYSRENPVAIHGATDGLTALFKRVAEVTLHQAQPIAIGRALIFGVNRGDRIFAILNSADGRLKV